MIPKFNLATKVITAFLGIGSIATCSYFTYKHFSTTRISDHISKNDLILLTSQDAKEEWAKRWKEYVGDTKNSWNIKNYNQLKSDLLNPPEEFKNYCLNNYFSPLEAREKTLYKEIENWCTKSENVSKLLENDSVTFLDTTSGDNDWINTWKRYADNNEENPLGLDNWPSAKTNKTNLPTDYKKKCELAKEKEARNKKDINYLTFKNWCTK